MTWLWRIGFSLILLRALAAGDVSGTVRLSHSRLAAVRSGRDYSGAVIWLEPVSPAQDRAAVPHARLTMEQKGKRFVPHVLAAPVGATVRFPNLDNIFHSAFSNFSGQIFDFGLYAPGTSRDVTFTRPGVVRIFCNIHSEMSAVIVVLKYPWFAVSDEAGGFTVRDVPAGEYRAHVFHERATQETLDALVQSLQMAGGNAALAPIAISESGYIESPHRNKYGLDYPPNSGSNGYPAGHP